MTQELKRCSEPIRRAHYVGTSVVLTIDPLHVKRLQIDDMTFFVQRSIENGILLELKKFEGLTHGKKQNDSQQKITIKVNEGE